MSGALEQRLEWVDTVNQELGKIGIEIELNVFDSSYWDHFNEMLSQYPIPVSDNSGYDIMYFGAFQPKYQFSSPFIGFGFV